MKVDFTVDSDDLKALYLQTRDCMKKGITLQQFINNCEADYEQYFERKIQLNEDAKTFSQWINGQIIALTGWL